MRIHAILHGSRANGPGLRTVVWAQGCDLGCLGCCNQRTWDASKGEEIGTNDLAHKVFRGILPGTTGITVSGGEPMQQAVSLYWLLDAIRNRRPDFSLGMFTGYTNEELLSGNYGITEPAYGEARDRGKLWRAIYPMLDFVKCGRYRRDLPGSDKPLCSSVNQDLLLPTSRYTYADFPPQCEEYNFEADGLCIITGIPLK